MLIYGLHSSGILCSSDSLLQTLWQHLSVPSARVQQSKKTYAQTNFYACLWSLNGLKDPDRKISTLKMIQGTGNCSLFKIQKVMKVHVLVARLLMTLNWRWINWKLSGIWLVRFFTKIVGRLCHTMSQWAGAGEDVRSIHVTGDMSWGVAAQQQNKTNANSFHISTFVPGKECRSLT